VILKNPADNHGVTPLHEAAANGHHEVSQLLFTQGADVDAQDKWKETPLHFAAAYGHPEVTMVLIAAGADLTIRSDYGYTPLGCAIYNSKNDKHGNWREVERLLRAAGAPCYYENEIC